MQVGSRHWSLRLPFYYGWLIIGIAFVTMAIGVTARTAFSLLMPPLIDEFGWDRGLAAGAFSFGFLVSAVLSPIVGRVMDARGPRLVILTGVLLMTAGLLLAPSIELPWHLYATLGVLVGAGVNMMTYTAHSQFLPNWFVRRRGLAISIAFSGVGVGAIVLLPWLQSIIVTDGWRASCWAMGLLAIFVAGPLNLLVRKKPEDIGLLPDGASQMASAAEQRAASNVVDPAWAAIEWTLARAVRTSRFWWIVVGYFCALIAWYAVQVHQTKYLIEIGFTPLVAAWALGVVSVVGIPGQISLGGIVGPGWPGVGMDGWMCWVRNLLCRADCARAFSVKGPALFDGYQPRLPWLRAHISHGPYRRRDIRRAALWLDLRHDYGRIDRWWRGRTVGDGSHSRRNRKLQSSFCFGDRVLCHIRRSNLDRSAPQCAAGARSGVARVTTVHVRFPTPNLGRCSSLAGTEGELRPLGSSGRNRRDFCRGSRVGSTRSIDPSLPSVRHAKS
jgi:MFS family permease